MTYHFIIRGYNCAPYIKECLNSILAQTHRDWVATVCLDAPTDNSYEKAIKFTKDRRIKVYRNRKRLGVAGNLIETIQLAAPSNDDVLVIVDADDRIIPRALEIVNNEYCKNKYLQLTYGSYWRMNFKRRTKTSKPYKNNKSVRKQSCHGSHLKTVKYSLFKHIPIDYFKKIEKGTDNVVWFNAASDIALVLPLWDLIGVDRYKTHTKWIKKPIYIYRGKTFPKIRGSDQFKNKKLIYKKKPLERLEVL